MWWSLIIVLVLLIPILAIVLESPALRLWIERRNTGTHLANDELRELTRRLQVLEDEVDELARGLEGLREESQFLQRLIEDSDRGEPPRLTPPER